jgi:hypothetical protein
LKKTKLNLHPAPDESLPEKQEYQALVPNQTDWLRIGQFVFSSLAALILLSASFISIVLTLFQDSIAPSSNLAGSNLSAYLFAAGLGGMGLLMIPSAIYSGRRLFGNGSPRHLRWSSMAWIGFIALPLLVLGLTIQTGPEWTRGFLPVIHLLANTAAIFWLLDFARKKLPDQSASRFWGSFATGLGLTTLITFGLEILILFGIGLIWTLLMSAMPDFRNDLLDLANLVRDLSGNRPALQRVLEDFTARPGVLFTLFGYVAVLIPIVEELLKPAAVWLLIQRKLQPWEGFVLGATSGAGYALFENLTIGAAADIWAFVTLTRLGTAAVHIFTAGLMGWGLASAKSEKKVGLAFGTFIGAVGLHGLWNGLNILAAVGEYPAVRDRIGSFGAGLSDYATVALVVIALGSFGGMIKANTSFRRAIIAGSD